MIKEELYRWLRLDRPTEESGEPYPPGYCHFPQYGEEYFKQITAEQLVTRVVKGYRRTEWQKTRDRNEAIDARTYARSAAATRRASRTASARHPGPVLHQRSTAASLVAPPFELPFRSAIL